MARRARRRAHTSATMRSELHLPVGLTSYQMASIISNIDIHAKQIMKAAILPPQYNAPQSMIEMLEASIR